MVAVIDLNFFVAWYLLCAVIGAIGTVLGFNGHEGPSSIVVAVTLVMLIVGAALQFWNFKVYQSWRQGHDDAKLPAWLRPHYSVRIIGLESGTIGPALKFVRFRRLEQAQYWCDKANADATDGLTRFEPVEI